ncbi:sulfotransferase family protein [Actinomadura rudentiformis]|uniref:Sulfotransferase n=1 Tax=Actinomadura rudentiformis TaxID=359158 RepID=A0A6H9YT01_9ACTN|nr:sulfotransferase [Actinomadura rudentiformis]KAB2348583.1 sulfotransferase [Actinomadura rudentiformis]
MTTTHGGTQPPGGSSLEHRLATLRRLRAPQVADFTAQINELVVLVSSSRSGSSMLTALLRESVDLLHLRGEFNPFLKLAGLAYPVANDSDRLDPAHWHALSPARRRVLDEELVLDAGHPADQVDDGQYLLDAAWRLTVQWPALDLDPGFVVEAGRRALERVRHMHGWSPGELRDVDCFHGELLSDLSRAGYAIDPRHYRMWASSTQPPPTGAPGQTIIEEPPFMTVRPWHIATEHDCTTKPLVLHTPSNNYRLGFLPAMFPNARMRIIYLTRNPAASINGLFDGWRHPGFYIHRMTEPLCIGDYTDARPADRWWWKFDLPPGWQHYTDASLMSVCAFQWRSAHQAALTALDGGAIDHIQLRYEDLISSSQSRIRSLTRLSQWLGIPLTGRFALAVQAGLPPVVSTAPPSPRRWHKRATMIHHVLDPDILHIANRLGYGSPTDWL